MSTIKQGKREPEAIRRQRTINQIEEIITVHEQQIKGKKESRAETISRTTHNYNSSDGQKRPTNAEYQEEEIIIVEIYLKNKQTKTEIKIITVQIDHL